MAFANPAGTSPLQFSNGGAITANSAVKLDTTEGRVVACTAITDNPIGICASTGSATAGADQLTVYTVAGTICKARIGGTVTVGQSLMVKGSGTGELDVAAGSTALTIAEALQGGSSGDIIAVLLRAPAKSPANT